MPLTGFSRALAVLDWLRDAESVGPQDIADKFGVSMETAKSDFAKLVRHGYIVYELEEIQQQKPTRRRAPIPEGWENNDEV